MFPAKSVKFWFYKVTWVALPNSPMNTRTSGFSEDEVGWEGQGQSRFYPLPKGMAVLVFAKWTENSAKPASLLVAHSISNHLIQEWGEHESSSEASDGIASMGWREAEQRTGWPLPAAVRFLVFIFCLVTALQAVVMLDSRAVWTGLNSPSVPTQLVWLPGELVPWLESNLFIFFLPTTSTGDGETENEELGLLDWCYHICTHLCCLSLSNC